MAGNRVDQIDIAGALRNHEARIRALEATPAASELGYIRFNLYPQDGGDDWLEINTDGESPHSEASVNFDGLQYGFRIRSIDETGEGDSGFSVTIIGDDNEGISFSVDDDGNSGIFFATNGAGNSSITLQNNDGPDGAQQILIETPSGAGIELTNTDGTFGIQITDDSNTGNGLTLTEQGTAGIYILDEGGGAINGGSGPSQGILLNETGGGNIHLTTNLSQFEGIYIHSPGTAGPNIQIIPHATSYMTIGNGTSGTVVNANVPLIIGQNITIPSCTTEPTTAIFSSFSTAGCALYTYDDGSHLHLKVLFDNGTVDTLATD